MEMKTKENILEELRENGYAILPDYWSKDKCQEALDQLESIPMQAFEGGQGGDKRFQHTNRYSESANEFLNDAFIQDIANNYSKCKDADRVMTTVLNHYPDRESDSGGGWHVDSKQPHQFKALLYLTDVDEDNGPFTFVRKSRDIVKDLPMHSNNRITDETVEENVDPSDVIECLGPAGTCILADTTFLHRGKKIEKGKRVVYTTYFYDRS
tara:strand:- start:2408 stop:3040 length:633 start_codon:yes stop_codon:yes gene_type:complete